MSKHVVIIGAGVGGLGTAIRLACRGLRVSVYERGEAPGGKLGQKKSGDYLFDAGPSLFTQPANIEELFSLAGEDIRDYLQYVPVEIACKYWYPDGTHVHAYTKKEEFARELQAKTGENPASVVRYLERAEDAYKHIGRVFLDFSLHRRSTWLNRRIIPALRSVRLGYLLGSLHQWNRDHLKDTRTIQLFDRFATYNGSNPYKAPGMLSMIPHLEQNEGTFYPKGGMISITRALYKLALKKGVVFHFHAPVDRIISTENRVKGVVVHDKNVMADAVVSNVDVYYTYKHLLHDDISARRVLKQERSSSALIFYWGISRRLPDLHLHNIFFTRDYRREFEHLFQLKTLYEEPTIYVNVPSRMEEGHAPPGRDNWFVMLNAPAHTGQDWEQVRERARAVVLKILSERLGTPIEPLIETELVMDPRGIQEETASYMGSLYGTSSNSRMAAFLRHPNFSRRLRGLYFVGGSVHPGGGIPLCLRGAKIVTGEIASFLKHAH